MTHEFSQGLALYLVTIMKPHRSLVVLSRASPRTRLIVKKNAFAQPVSLALCSCTPAAGHWPRTNYRLCFSIWLLFRLMCLVYACWTFTNMRNWNNMGKVAVAGALSTLSGMPIAGAIVASNGWIYWGAAVFSGCALANMLWIIRRCEALNKPSKE